MNPDDKKTALRMIPYGLYILTGRTSAGRVAASTVTWVTQAGFEPTLVVVGVKVGSTAHEVILESRAFALHMLGKDQQATAFAFFKSVALDGETIGGQPFRAGSTGAPILEDAPAYVECSLVESVDRGDHSIFIGEVVDAGVATGPDARTDEGTLTLRDLGGKIFYGG